MDDKIYKNSNATAFDGLSGVHDGKWKNLSAKDKVALTTAVISFALGWILVFASFVVPPLGIVGDSVLLILGESMIYTASVLGIYSYFSASIRKSNGELKRFFLEALTEHLGQLETLEKKEEESEET